MLFYLKRFLEQSQRVQDAVLLLIAQLILTEIDVPINKVTSANVQPVEGKRFRRNSGKFPKPSPSKSDSGFSTGDHHLSGLSLPSRPRQSSFKSKNVSWNCLSQYCLLLLTSNNATAVKVANSLEPLVNLGSPCLRVALFRQIILPLIMRYRTRESKDASDLIVGRDTGMFYYDVWHTSEFLAFPFYISRQRVS